MATKIRNQTFTEFDCTTGKLFDYSNSEFPSNLHAWNSQKNCDSLVMNNPTSTYYGYVYEEDQTILSTVDGDFPLKKGMYFSLPGGGSISGGKGIIIERQGYKGLFTLGGPIEQRGRLKYIDGCTDSILVPPVKLGDPCLNVLYFPANTNQTEHTHSSVRMVIVVKGTGECITYADITSEKEYIPLKPGTIFVVRENQVHAFRTFDSEMVVVAYHPDSDFGPQDENHPMLNRTIVQGISAAKIEAIKTR
jgi:mannose-6-phosphate isomerase-like protein (cupin superfamily)